MKLNPDSYISLKKMQTITSPIAATPNEERCSSQKVLQTKMEVHKQNSTQGLIKLTPRLNIDSKIKPEIEELTTKSKIAT